MENSHTLGIDDNKDRPAQFSPKRKIAKSSKSCSVCGKFSTDCRELIFHEFPTDRIKIKTQDVDGNIVMKYRRHVWHDKTLVSTNLKKPFICSSHFLQSDYFTLGAHRKKASLKKNAVPSVNLPIAGTTLREHRQQQIRKNKLERKKALISSSLKIKSGTEEKKSSVALIQKNIILQPIIYISILFPPICFDEFWCNAHKIILPNERWSFCKLETTECGKELVFSEIMYDGKSKMRSTKKQVVLSCQNGFQYFIHSEELTSKQISTRIDENVHTIESLQFLLAEVDKAEVSNGVIKSSRASSHHASYQDKTENSMTDKMPCFEPVHIEDVALQESDTKELDEMTIDPFVDTNQEQCNKWPLKRKKSQKNINLDPIADSKQLQCKIRKIYGSKVLLKMKNSKLDQLSPNEIQDLGNDVSQDDYSTIESVFIKEENIDYQDEAINSEQNETIDSEQLMFIKEESCDIPENEDLTFLSDKKSTIVYS